MDWLKKNYDKVIPLCEWHHRGVDPSLLGWWGVVCNRPAPEDNFGPSLAHNKPAFHDRFGSPEQLLEEVKELENERDTS